jgi:hypothetical protein
VVIMFMSLLCGYIPTEVWLRDGNMKFIPFFDGGIAAVHKAKVFCTLGIVHSTLLLSTHWNSQEKALHSEDHEFPWL